MASSFRARSDRLAATPGTVCALAVKCACLDNGLVLMGFQKRNVGRVAGLVLGLTVQRLSHGVSTHADGWVCTAARCWAAVRAAQPGTDTG